MELSVHGATRPLQAPSPGCIFNEQAILIAQTKARFCNEERRVKGPLAGWPTGIKLACSTLKTKVEGGSEQDEEAPAAVLANYLLGSRLRKSMGSMVTEEDGIKIIHWRLVEGTSDPLFDAFLGLGPQEWQLYSGLSLQYNWSIDSQVDEVSSAVSSLSYILTGEM